MHFLVIVDVIRVSDAHVEDVGGKAGNSSRHCLGLEIYMDSFGVFLLKILLKFTNCQVKQGTPHLEMYPGKPLSPPSPGEDEISAPQLAFLLAVPTQNQRSGCQTEGPAGAGQSRRATVPGLRRAAQSALNFVTL